MEDLVKLLKTTWSCSCGKRHSNANPWCPELKQRLNT